MDTVFHGATPFESPALANIKGLPVSGVNETINVRFEFFGHFWGKRFNL